MKQLSIKLTIAAVAAIWGAGFTATAQKATYTLQQCRQLALQNNASLKRANIDISDAKLQREAARMSYLPTVSAGVSYFHAIDDMVKQRYDLTADDQQKLAALVQQLGLNPAALASLPTSYEFKAFSHGMMANITVLEPIYTGGRRPTAVKLADLQGQVKQLMLRQTHDDVVKTTEVYYNRLLSLYEKLATLDAVDRQLASIHTDALNAIDAGVGLRNDLLKVELKQNEMAADRLTVENGIKLSKLVLAQYMGVMDKGDFDIDRTPAASVPDPVEYRTDHHAALDSLTEARLLDKGVEAAKLQTRLKRGALLPTLSVGAMGMYGTFTNEGRFKVAGLATLSVPISDWWSDRSVKRQIVAERKAEVDREDNRQLLLINMQNQWDNLDNAYKQVQLARKSIEQSDENLRLNEDYYKAGTSTMTDVLDAQTLSRQARDRYSDAVVTYLDCRTAYLQATGRQVQ